METNRWEIGPWELVNTGDAIGVVTRVTRGNKARVCVIDGDQVRVLTQKISDLTVVHPTERVEFLTKTLFPFDPIVAVRVAEENMVAEAFIQTLLQQKLAAEYIKAKPLLFEAPMVLSKTTAAVFSKRFVSIAQQSVFVDYLQIAIENFKNFQTYTEYRRPTKQPALLCAAN